AQKIAEKLMIAIPVPLIVEAKGKKVTALQHFKYGLTVRLIGEDFAQIAVQAFENAGTKQELLRWFGLSIQHLFAQIIQNVAVIARKHFDEGWHILLPAHGECRQLQSCGPSFSASFQSLDGV